MDSRNITAESIKTDLLVIGGGTAGCVAAISAAENQKDLDILIAEKADIDRSGCLASGLNAINAYINPGETEEDFVEYVKKDAMGLIRDDLVLSIARRLNKAVHMVEEWGLPIIKDEDGNYKKRGRWNIEINGESLKPILADKVREMNIKVKNRIVITNLIIGRDRVVRGAYGFGVRDGKYYIIEAKATIVATGGASGIYRPNNDGSAHHKIWYSPFNTGAGYAMGIRAGAEMTSFEMRFIALRVKDIIAPTGTLALGFGAKQINSAGERFMAEKFADLGAEGAPTPIRVYGPTREVKEGRGPIFMDATHLSDGEVKELKKSYLNMYPDLVLYWAANGFNPAEDLIEIRGTEPYLVGGHAQAGYWINKERETTLKGLYAAGDVAGGAPYKFVSGCWVEGLIAGENAVDYIQKDYTEKGNLAKRFREYMIDEEKIRIYRPFLMENGIKAKEMEEHLQKVMDEYAGGVSRYYEMNEKELNIALKKIKVLKKQIKYLYAKDLHQLMSCHEVIDRIYTAEVMLYHLIYRQETRWPAYQSRTDYPELDNKNWLKFVNSHFDGEKIEIIERPYIKIV